jgi:hypothetical protein
MNRFDTRFGTQAKTAAHIHVKAIAVASITTGIVVGLVAAGAAGPLGSLRPHVAQHLVRSAVASTRLSADALFPNRVEHPASSGQYVAYVVPPTEVGDDNQESNPAPQPQEGGGSGGGGDS